MRKVFLFLATAALFASCSDDLLEPNNGFQAQDLSSKGITFTVVDDAATRGMIDDKDSYKAYFFAEEDQIDIYAVNAQKWNSDKTGGADFEDLNVSAWTAGQQTKTAVYKATSSMADPKFTATKDDYRLGLKTYAANHVNRGKFFVTYPTGQSVSHVPEAKVGSVTTPAHFQITAKDLSEQNYAGFMNMDNRYMYAYAEAEKAKEESIKEQNQSFGERVDLRLQSPLSTALFVIRDLKDYDFGNLKTIEFESEYSPLVPDVVTEDVNDEVDATDLITVDTKTYLEGDLDVSFKDGKPEYDKNGKLVYKVRKDGKGNIISPTTAADDPILGDCFTFTPSNAKGKEMAYVSNKRYQKKATLSVNKKIAQDEEMNLFVLPAEHSAEKQETYTITYIFDKVTLQYTHTTSGSLAANEKALRFNLWIGPKDDKTPATFPYIVTNESTTGAKDRQLIVNTGNFNDIFDSKTGEVKWSGTTVDPKEFSSIIINKDVKALDEKANAASGFNDSWDFLNQFTSVTELKILNGTTTLVDVSKMAGLATAPTEEHPTNLTANVKTVNADAIPVGIKVLELPNVESFKAPKNNFSALTDLVLSSYNGFKDDGDAKPEVFFNGNTGGTLKTIDLRGVSSLQAVKSRHNGIKFNNFTALTTISMKDDVVITAEEFKGCTSLATITGALDITNASDAFSGCTILTDVRIKGNVIPAGTFRNSSVERIHTKDWTGPGKGNANIDKNLVQPTVIGAEAFKGNAKIVSLDFSNTTSIGAGAFDGATSFKGKDATVTLPAAVKTVEANTFNGTAVEIFILKGVTETKAMSLNSTVVNQIAYETTEDLKIAFDDPATTGAGKDEGQVANTRTAKVAIFVQSAANAAKFDGKGYGSVVNEKE